MAVMTSLDATQIKQLLQGATSIDSCQSAATTLAQAGEDSLAIEDHANHVQLCKVQIVLLNRLLQMQHSQGSAADDVCTTYQKIGRLWLDLGEYEKTIGQVKKALALQPESTISLALIGEAHLALADFDQAQQAFDQVVKIHSSKGQDLTNAMLHVSHVHEGRGAFHEALNVLKDAETKIQAGATDEDILDAQARLYEHLGKLYERTGDYSSAVTALSKAHDLLQRLKGGDHPQTQQVGYLMEMALSLVDG